MGSDVHVVVVGGTVASLELARELIAELETRWSRFRDDSEVSLLNREAGRPVRVSGATLALVERALEGARVTDGRYDPTVLRALERAGYHREGVLRGAQWRAGAWHDLVLYARLRGDE